MRPRVVSSPSPSRHSGTPLGNAPSVPGLEKSGMVDYLRLRYEPPPRILYTIPQIEGGAIQVRHAGATAPRDWCQCPQSSGSQVVRRFCTMTTSHNFGNHTLLIGV